MQHMTTAQIRQQFLDFFASKQHQVVPSSSLIPGNDATLLFNNAGMVQFKDVFLGAESRPYTRATSSQRCVRAGGKHNDLENVGYTARHHTFFEMLGNFSFGDYFKQDAIKFAWQFLTEEVKLPKEKLLVTIYHDDEEAFNYWSNDIGLPADRIIRIATADNFWSMGDTGPCGPCSEIFYDHGEHIWGGPPGSPEEDGDRFIEIWNLVFMQYNRQNDGTMLPLPKQSVDTGMGLERIAAILQGVHSNYEIDLFKGLIAAAASVTNAQDMDDKSLRVVADHIRSCAFLISDGVMPSNEGRGYVLRRIIRRAVRHGNKLGAQGAFFYKLVAALIEQMGQAYPELAKQQEIIEKVLRIEEEQFGKTLERGLAILEESLSDLKGDVIPGDLVFKLYDTYGFPADLTADVARERQMTIDNKGFEECMAVQRKTAQQAGKFGADYNDQLKSDKQTTYKGYTTTSHSATVVEVFAGSESVSLLEDGQKGIVILDRTPFYAESGGQVGDTGVISVAGGEFTVTNTTKLGNAFAHHGIVQGRIGLNDKVEATIDDARRERIKKNHTATHILHETLRQLLGEHVGQKGSLVQAERLRFDFSHFEAVTKEELREIERVVNDEIRCNFALSTELMAIDDAKAKGAMALFGEKYDDEVRVVTIGDYSIELCGGTHVERAGDIGLFKIVSESGIAAGVRRIEAVTGADAIAYVSEQEQKLNDVAAVVKADSASVLEKVTALLDKSKQLEKQIAQLNDKLASAAGASLLDSVVEINGIKLLIANVKGTESKALRGMVDDLKNKIGSGVIALGVASDDKVSLIAGVTKDLTGRVKAGELVNHMASQVGGKGGGRPDMAQAGGSEPENLTAALDSVTAWFTEKTQA
ncbi:MULTISPECIES: alanine--tRNA ligase [Pseudoalteromonas]|jgi:alanyl-tRNA synthetase|uniref:Alanine--tRNA ligase n=5 Tax=Gammaproteobacteria TaxID=1236 RepID=SYA_PSET1|nr:MULTISPECIES: alanine--tRNA ligase [Pseudoalteromonas]Q3ILF3.1 RecName: Full=Alanine--tRNA ligase; AltName: Full=Alanyl-tRNA synthetase; Short=AlaRS [Pseudoalteromonas translucida TAC125]ASM52934.1 alanyl-tRNA synthetase [Pseudoalteromonas nigrifaciens]MBB1370192.1 alanine--tRNA ligase [Pseudoalteromonas sp. SR45-4]MBB1405466.1 alanine--tRNA ligase [Pseudoalteromonas sp. SG44-5]MBE0420786.1 alanine--tRNA ligase [Pseudoalteromonas nigrifaciens]MBH0092503.1 alanine--tRNA ligase [Pseudoaltero|tara:strand:- start:21790 stop:24396 length:2607 start_codon:yes stop_codon:yes gene_type:complete